MAADFLFIGAHPDDVEWGAGGISLLLNRKKVPFVILDLTRGELGSWGTVELRHKEGFLAAEFLGADSRENLGLSDGKLVDCP